jgi:hypothetical protein
VNKQLCIRFGIAVLAAATAFSAGLSAQVTLTTVVKMGYEVELRSDSKIFADQVNATGKVMPLDEPTTPMSLPTVPQIHFKGGNVQANDPSLDYIQIFPGFRSFVHFTQSETSVAASA